MKVIYHVGLNDGSMDFFFDDKENLLHYWNCNDACYRREYMKPLFKALKIDVVEAEFNQFKDKIVPILYEQGCGEDDVKYLLDEE